MIRTLQMRRLSKDELRVGALLYPERGYWKPRTRADCANVARPCPYVSCRHHLYLDVTEAGSLRLNHPGKEPWELEHSCALDIASTGELETKEVAAILGLTRQRVEQIQHEAIAKYTEAACESEKRTSTLYPCAPSSRGTISAFSTRTEAA